VGLNETSALHGFLRQICDRMHRQLHMRIQVGNFEAACRMIEAHVGVGIMPESAARRHTKTMAICSVPLTDPWAFRANLVCVRSLDALPSFARDLVALLAEDAKSPTTTP
jgi:DNA-binding transcriptional LysR family regulator